VRNKLFTCISLLKGWENPTFIRSRLYTTEFVWKKMNIVVLTKSLTEDIASMHHIHPALVHGESLTAHGVLGPWSLPESLTAHSVQGLW
jgi:hypothetical protein